MPDQVTKPAYRSFHYGPDGEARIFTDEADIPEGWEDHPGKVKAPAPKSDKEPDDAMATLRAEYAEKMGKKPFMGWDEATLREKMGAAPPGE